MAKTDWTSKDTVRPEDMNDIGEEINDLESSVTVWLGVTEGTGTKYTVTSSKVSSLFESLRVSFRVHQTSGADPTLQINGLGAVPLKKPNGRAAKLDADGVYTAVYSAASFILQGEGGEIGTAGPDQVLEGYTVPTESGLQPGRIPRVENVGIGGEWLNPDGGTDVDARAYGVLPQGLYNMATDLRVYISDPNLISKNIKSGSKIFNVPGDPNVVDTSNATATAAEIAAGKVAYVKGQKVTGTRGISLQNYDTTYLDRSLSAQSSYQWHIRDIPQNAKYFTWQSVVFNDFVESWIEATGINTSVILMICDDTLNGVQLKQGVGNGQKRVGIWGLRFDLTTGYVFMADDVAQNAIYVDPAAVNYSKLRLMVLCENWHLSMAQNVKGQMYGYCTIGA